MIFDRPTASLRYLAYCRAYAAASAVHLTLPDALDDPRWWPANAAYWAGALLLFWRGNAAGWLLCAVGLAIPLAFLEDQLTQSVYLLACAIAALACWAGRAEGRPERMARGLPAVVRVLTSGTYAIAALHKLNWDFVDPAVSCANGGLRILADNWAIPSIASPALDPIWPALFLAAEVSVATLLVVRPAWGMLIALLMHIPLTIVFAPSFAFVMISGWVCLLGEDELVHLLGTLAARWRSIVAIGMGLGALSFALYMVNHWVVYPFWSFKEALLWTALVWLVWSIRRRPPALLSWWSAWRERPPRSLRAAPGIAAVLLVAHGLLPYTGLELHHTGAMLSNLRIDRGCWNSLVFPESMRIADPYVRIDAVELGDVEGRDALASSILGSLHGLGELDRARRRWCDAGAGPIRVRGTYRGRAFETDDLCREWPLPEPFMPGFRRYQTNLGRECPEACIH